MLVLATPWIPGLTDLAALRQRIDPSIFINTTPLRLPPELERTRRALGVEQHEVNRAYLAEYQRLHDMNGIRWSRPPPLDGSPPHMRDNIGRRHLRTTEPAPTAPDLGPPLPVTRWPREEQPRR